MPKVVLDTNVLLSGIAYPASIPGKILSAWRGGSIDLLLSAYILEELRRVLPRLAHRHGLSGAEIDDLVDALAIQAEIIEPEPSNNPRLRDAADKPLLDTLLAALAISEADYPSRRATVPLILGIDTNVLVRFLVHDDEAQFLRSQKLIRREIAAGRPVFVSLLVLLDARQP